MTLLGGWQIGSGRRPKALQLPFGRRTHAHERNAHSTKRLNLVPTTLEEIRATVEAMNTTEKANQSADWLTRLHASTSAV